MMLKHKISQYKFFLVSLLFLIGLFFVSSHVLAVAGDTFGVNKVGSVLPLGGEDIRVIAAKIIRIFLSLLGVIAVGLMLYAGFTWMTSGGNEEKIASAKKILINATIGLAIIMSSFAITQFILSSLQGATGSGNADEAGGRGAVPLCANFADCQAVGGGPHECGDEGFVVKSLTPRTPTNNPTGMSNTVIRAVFSRPLDAGQDLNQIFKLVSGNNPIPVKNVKILGDRYIVEAYFSKDTNLCNADGNNQSCLTPGEYNIEVNPNLVADGVKLQTKLSCGVFDNTAYFSVNRDFLDVLPPFTDSITFNGRNINDQATVARGSKYRLNATFEDRRREDGQNISFGGISYLSLNVKSEPQDPAAAKTNWSYYTGTKNTSNDALSLSQDLVFGDEFPVPSLYTLTFDVADIDHNNHIVTSTFVLDGELCHNGKQDPGETGIDVGGQCLGDGQCNANWQCISGECDLATHQCVNNPVIQSVDVGGVNPESWDGASGSWATIVGNFFGADPGAVDFGIDNDNNGSVDQWVAAPLANCNGLDVWTPRQVIVEIPNIPVGTSTTIRLTTRAVGQNPAAVDLSTDDHGPKAGPHKGIFTISNNDHPGLCAVLNPLTNTNIATTTAPVTAFGRALGNGGNSSLLFGGVAAPVRQWREETILSSVPQNMKSGRVGVRAKIGDAYTNGVEFIVADQDADLTPHIDSLSPSPTSTLESLLTISGARFGASGVAYIASTADAALLCAATQDRAIEAACARLDLVNLPAACGNTWSDTQIIGKIPAGIPLGQYFVVVKNDAGHNSDGTAKIVFVEGAPLPGLCRIEPNTGVAPLPAGAEPLSLTGINLNPNPELYFWSINHWLRSSVDLDPQGGHNIIQSVSANGTNIRTFLPVGGDGVSMTTGPILAKVGASYSNAVRYTVDDCTQGGNAPGADYQCCTNGPEKGLWKPQAFACSGETRSAGYIWRFTTGLIPKVPRVVEACNIEDWNDVHVNNFVRPSPSPWNTWNVGDACIDSVITVQFNMHMSAINLDSAVRVYTCGQGDTPDCVYDAAHDVTSRYTPVLLPGGNENILELRLADGQTHVTSTWYRVILGNTLHANEHSNDGKVNTTPLSLQRPLKETVNGITVAYNFDFKTGNNRCTLFGAGVTPPNYTTHLLGMLQDPGFPVSPNFDNPTHPFYYYVWGRGTQACSVVDVNGKGWEWKPRQNVAADASSTYAYATKSDTVGIPEASSTYYKDVRATVTALQNTLLTPVRITATTNTMVDGVEKVITGSSDLYIQLGDPTVVQKWPECNQSCTNANIGVRFNLPMVTSTYRKNGTSAIRVQRCLGLGENCLNLDNPLVTRDIDDGGFDPYQYEVSIPGSLELNTLYQVTVTDQIHSFGGILNNQIVDGRPLIPAVWKFRTKVKDGICVLDKVDVVPNPFVASLVGQKTAYGASALSSPDQCSPLGQRLNPWAYGWNWSIEHPEVATTTHFSTKGTPADFCSGRCLPVGSDVPAGEPAYLCGNGTVDPGEDCDIAANINNDPNIPERPGVSCSLNCLRPGNQSATTTVNPANLGWCGNGALEQELGEECDPGIPGEKPYCSKTCNWTGSSQEFSADPNALQCGNGRVGLSENALTLVGEECDLGISLEAALSNNVPSLAAFGCSQSCLHEGTPLSRAYCANPNSRLTPDQKQSVDCQNAFTICGDGHLDPGEECEANPLDNHHITVFTANGIIDTIAVGSATSTCSNRCILKNICEVRNQISSDFACERGTPGCTDECTKAGSSALYETPSLCGDGDTGTGENFRCEAGVDDNARDLDEDPLQVVTAIGNGQVNTTTLMQETQVFVHATQVKESATFTRDLGNNFSGAGKYSLQCGYIEYPQPVEQDGVLHSNNCPDPSQGVGTNSCCQLRASRVSEYPVEASGIADNTQVCRNTYIEAHFDRVIDPTSIGANIMIASLHPANYDCASSTETNVTDEISDLVIAYSGDQGNSTGIFARAWIAVKQFFVTVFNSVVHAEVIPNQAFILLQNEVSGKVWCTGAVTPKITVNPKFHEDGTPDGSTVSLYVDNLLNENTTYAVVLRGGNAGIKDVGGVGIRGKSLRNPENKFLKDDVFVFKTSNQICKIQSISVTPDTQLYTAPSSTHHFVASVESTLGGPIVSTPAYAWEWGWQPENNNLYTVSSPNNTPEIDITSKNVEGSLIMSAQAIITIDRSDANIEVGRVYSGLSSLTSLFCENPWPSQGTFPYQEGSKNDDNFNSLTNNFDGSPIPPVWVENTSRYLNFSFGYCADSGKSATTSDDLPMLRPVVSGNLVGSGNCNNPAGAICFQDSECPFVGGQRHCINIRPPQIDNTAPTSTLKKFLFFNEQNTDVIGVQVFANADRKTARQWFVDQGFSGIERYQNIVIDGYDAITDGNNTYVNALNELPDKRVHNYIYLFGINGDAQGSTKKVLDRIMTSLRFNTNIPERGLCIAGNGTSGGQYLPLDLSNIAVTSIACNNDYECRNALGVPTAQTNGLCADAKTKFQRDWSRLAVIKDIQAKVEDFRTKNGGYPNLPAGTYVPGYTNTHWPSWNRLLESIGTVSAAPLNQWSACGYCANTIQVNGHPQYVACSTDADCAASDAHNDLGKCNVPDDQQTCWNSQTATFACPAVSNVLEYTATSSKNYTLFLPLEYFNGQNNNQSQIINTFVDATHYSSTASCGQNGLQVIRPAAGSCGNGIREQGEDWDPAGVSVVVPGAVCPQGQIGYKTSDDTCHWGAVVCRAAATCGNGRIDQGESCDDGNLNNTYGHCSQDNNCTGPYQNYCGNGHIDNGPNGAPLEQCDKLDPAFQNHGYCNTDYRDCVADATCGNVQSGARCLALTDPTYHIRERTIVPGAGFNTQNKCAADCQSSGGYCGDGKLQLPYETCDDGNTNPLDGCGTYCQVENQACAATIPAANLSIDNFDPNRPDTLVKISYNDSTPAECQGTTGGAICRGMGLECQNVQQKNPNGTYSILSGANALSSCDVVLNKERLAELRLHCDGTKQGVAAPIEEQTQCGNSQVDAGEVCDLGLNNGKICTPDYGTSCTYCAADCKKVLTNDSLNKCGNGVIDFDPSAPAGGLLAEACDVSSTLNMVMVLNTAGAQAEILAHQNLANPLQNPDYKEYLRNVFNRFTVRSACESAPGRIAVGQVRCSNDCKAIDTSSCAQCGEYNNAGKAIPKLAVLNVLSPSSTAPVNTKWGNTLDYYHQAVPNTNPVQYDVINGLPQMHRSFFLNPFLTSWNRTSPIGKCELQAGSRTAGTKLCNNDNDCGGGKACIFAATTPLMCSSLGWTALNAGIDYTDARNCGPNDGAAPGNRFTSTTCKLKHRKYTAAADETNYMLSQWMCNDGNGAPLDRTYGTQSIVGNIDSNNPNDWVWGEYTESIRQIETNPMCNGQYSVYFGMRGIQERRGGSGLGPNDGANLYGQPAANLRKGFYETYGDFFPYPVNGELHSVQNEFVLSPAVPRGTFRIVVKWRHFAEDADVNFSPIVYNSDFLANPAADASEKLASTVSYTNAVTYNRAHPEPARNRLCEFMSYVYNRKTPAEIQNLTNIGILNYWIPDRCESFYGHPVLGDPNRLSSGDVYVHGQGHLGSVRAQAITVVTGNSFGTNPTGYNDNPYAVFVESITPEGATPISSFADLDVTVEVYDYHNNQVPEYSLYLPRHTYKLKDADQSSNDPHLVRYWHVFNLVKNDAGRYEVEPVAERDNSQTYENGATVTNFAKVLCRIPGEPCSLDE